MKNLLALVGLLVVGFGLLGWYLGWYNLNVKSTPDGKYNVAGDIDSRKITDDVKNFGKKVGKVLSDDTPATPTTTSLAGGTFVGPPLPASLLPPPDNAVRNNGGGITIPIEITLPSPRR